MVAFVKHHKKHWPCKVPLIPSSHPFPHPSLLHIPLHLSQMLNFQTPPSTITCQQGVITDHCIFRAGTIADNSTHTLSTPVHPHHTNTSLSPHQHITSLSHPHTSTSHPSPIPTSPHHIPLPPQHQHITSHLPSPSSFLSHIHLSRSCQHRSLYFYSWNKC